MSKIFETGYRPLENKLPPFGMWARAKAQFPKKILGMDRCFEKPLTVALQVNHRGVEEEVSDFSAFEATVTEDSCDGFKLDKVAPKYNGIRINERKYAISNADIALDGVGEDDFAGIGCGIMADHGADVVLKDSVINMTGAGRTCTMATQGARLEVHNCKLYCNGGPIPEGYVPVIGPGMLEPPAPLKIGGTARAHLSIDNSKTYFYNTTIEADGWAALSTDGAKGYVYLEANDCDLLCKNIGYGFYSDCDCHVVLNNTRMKTATHGAIMAGYCQATCTNCEIESGIYGFMIHTIKGLSTEFGEAFIKGGSFHTGQECFWIKSENAHLDIDGVDLKSDAGLLIHSTINDDPFATKVNDDIVFGIKARLANMNLEGNIIHEDTERTMAINLENTTLKGVISQAYVSLKNSKWTATGNSEVILVGDVDVSSIDAPAGVTVTAGAGEGCGLNGTYTLAGGGILTVK